MRQSKATGEDLRQVSIHKVLSPYEAVDFSDYRLLCVNSGDH